MQGSNKLIQDSQKKHCSHCGEAKQLIHYAKQNMIVNEITCSSLNLPKSNFGSLFFDLFNTNEHKLLRVS